MAHTHHRIQSTSTSAQPTLLAMRASDRLERTTPNTHGLRNRPCTTAGHPSRAGLGTQQPASVAQRMQPHARQRPADSATTVMAMGPGKLVKRCAAMQFMTRKPLCGNEIRSRLPSRSPLDPDYSKRAKPNTCR
jgi:hypothetical protein